MVFDWISRLTTKDEDRHPLFDEESTRQFIADLPRDRAADLLGMALDVLETAQASKVPPAAFRAAVLKLHDAGRHSVGELWHTLFSDDRGDKLSRMRWQALDGYFTRMGPIFLAALETFRKPPEDEDDRIVAGKLCVLAFIALSRRNGLARVLYSTHDGAEWMHGEALKNHAKRLGLLRSPFTVHEPQEVQLTPQGCYTAVLLFDTAPLDNLLPPQVMCLGLWLQLNANMLAFSEQPNALSKFVFDTAAPGIPRKWLGKEAPKPTQCFIGPGHGLQHLESIAAEVQASGEVPEWALASGCTTQQIIDFARRMLVHWAIGARQRMHERQQVAGELLISHTLAQVRRLISASETAWRNVGRGMGGYEHAKLTDTVEFQRIRFDSVAEPTEKKAAAPSTLPADKKKEPVSAMALLEQLESRGDKLLMDRWVLINTSKGGFAARAARRPDWLVLGGMICARAPDEPDWRIGLVRRLNQAKKGGPIEVGVELLRGWPSAVSLKLAEGTKPTGWDDLPGVGLGYVDAILIRDDEPLLVGMPGFAEAGTRFELRADGKTTVIDVLESVESGPDFRVLRARYSTS